MIFSIAPGQLRLFFTTLLSSSREHQGIPENLVADSYLAEMLIRFVQPTEETIESLNTPLLSALYRLPRERPSGKKIRDLAETFLFLLGCYTEKLSRSGVGLATYVNATKTAYALVSARAALQNPFLDVFRSFSEDITPTARILHDLSDEWFRRDAADLFRLMNRYAVFHSSRDLEILMSRNVALLSLYDSETIIH